ncbi:hypothetical protein J4221_02935 [Candidatus Pacearchaeota archaeon]|nr:hypothetical protein [Candidatus Pacearchaeota archaeon]
MNSENTNLVDNYISIHSQIQELKNKLEEIKHELIEYADEQKAKILYGTDRRIFINEYEKVKFPNKGELARVNLKISLKEMNKLHLVTDLDIHALEKIIKEKTWDEEKLYKLSNFYKIVKIKIFKIEDLKKESTATSIGSNN